MKNKLLIGIILLFLGASLSGLGAPQTSRKPAKTDPAAAPATQETRPAEQPPALSLQPKLPLYDSAGRRDPFKDLLGGSQTKERAAEGNEIAISDLHLIGITKERGRIFALITGPQGFPYKIKEGDKFADGYVLKITLETVTFRQTMDRGLRLPNPRDIVKEINPEER
jgi:Tfp pilus assembly protein PilP